MPRRIDHKNPERYDIDDQYDGKIGKTVEIHKKLKSQGGYAFGDLTAEFCGLNETEKGYWKSDIDKNYPEPVQAIIKGVVDYAMSQTPPIKIKFDWHGGSNKEVKVAYSEQKRLYKIDIYGYAYYPAPPHK
jgi:hypothetical protein